VDEDDVEILAWALEAQPVPEKYAGPMMRQLQMIDYVRV